MKKVITVVKLISLLLSSLPLIVLLSVNMHTKIKGMSSLALEWELFSSWASDASPALGCSIEIWVIYVSVGQSVCL